MAKYPVKMLKDEQNQPFVPLVSAESIYTNDDLSFEEKFATKLEADNLKEGNGIILKQNGNDTTISVDFGATDNIIDNLNTTVAGQGPLDARQGNVLKNMIPTIVDNLDSTDATKVLSANQGHELKEMSVPTGGATGQVLKKASDNDHELEWGDAADPNAIVGDGTIMSIVELSYADYKALEAAGELKADTEYHITDVENGTASYMTEEQIQELILNQTNTKISKSYSYNNKDLNDLIDTAFYYCNSATNRPTSTNGYIFVQNTGTDYAYQRYITYNGARTYERVRMGGEWQPWTEVIYDSGWRDLELINGWSIYEGQVIPQIRRIGKHVYLRGLLLATADTTARYAVVIPEDCRPNIINNLYFSMIVANNNDSTKRCEMVQITPPDDGRILVFGSYKDTDWFGLENLHWSID